MERKHRKLRDIKSKQIRADGGSDRKSWTQITNPGSENGKLN